MPLAEWMNALNARLVPLDTAYRTGRVQEVAGTLIRVSGLELPVGELCELVQPDGRVLQRAEVVAFTSRDALLSPFGSIAGISGRTRVIRTFRPLSIPVGVGLLGRVLNATGAPIDGKGQLHPSETRAVMAEPPDPMSRAMIKHMMPTGVRIIDALLAVGEGQRVGIFAPAGVGKSTLMGMLARGARCDVNVITLIGERGREVREFIDVILGEEGMKRSVVICATSDRSSIERAKAAHVGTAVAEYFRDQGMKVMLMMDSVTRFARALREIGLAAGEPPARRGFPPSVFAQLPQLIERAGMNQTGSITAFYTILAEDDSGSDPVAEEMRGILDGHIVLSRSIAARNQYPAVDALRSLSRVMPMITSAEHQNAAARLRRLMALYEEVEPLIQAGEYKAGQDAETDEAVRKKSAVQDFLQQSTSCLEPFNRTRERLSALTGMRL